MPQIFHRSFNTISKVSIFGALFIVAAVFWVLGVLYRSPYVTAAGNAREQPVPFSHAHHVAELGIDCRYCHTSVEDSSFAGIPPTKTCMNCHSQIWVGSEMLEPIRTSYETGEPIEWQRVHDLPDFVYFNHSIHVNKGIGCVSCHGKVNEMPLVWQDQSLLMSWCLDCHRQPEQHVRPPHAIFDMTWKPGDDGYSLERAREELLAMYNIQVKTSCSVCHR